MSAGKLCILVALVIIAVACVVVGLSNGPRDPAALARHAENLASGDSDAVGKSLRALAESGDPAAVPASLLLLKSEDPWVWVHAALYLGAVRRPEAVPYLIKAGLKYGWAYSGAEESLAAMTGQNFGTDFEKWWEWWESGKSFSLSPQHKLLFSLWFAAKVVRVVRDCTPYACSQNVNQVPTRRYIYMNGKTLTTLTTK